MSNSIRLSEKHGVNPTLCQCFFCGETKHIALLGQIGDRRKGEDFEAPRECVMDYEPCDKCQEQMKQGVTLIGVTTTQPSDKRPPLTAQGGTQVYPTNAWCVIKSEVASEMFSQELNMGDKLFVDQAILDIILGGNKDEC